MGVAVRDNWKAILESDATLNVRAIVKQDPYPRESVVGNDMG
jgi:hypothetical protein